MSSSTRHNGPSHHHLGYDADLLDLGPAVPLPLVPAPAAAADAQQGNDQHQEPADDTAKCVDPKLEDLADEFLEV